MLSFAEVESEPHNTERDTFYRENDYLFPAPAPRFSRTVPADAETAGRARRRHRSRPTRLGVEKGTQSVEIKDAVAVVTGGASGLGLATTKRLLDAGAQVVVLDIRGKEAVAELGDRAAFAETDVTDEAAVTAALDIAESLGPVRIVINCAGTGNAIKTLGKDGPFPLDLFKKVVEINLIGTFNVIRLGAERIAKTEPINGERGVIVNTASVAAFDGQIGQAAYSASKGGVVGMTLPIARDLVARADPRRHHRAGAVRHAAAGGAARAGQGVAGQAGAAPVAAGQARRVRCAGRAHRREPDAQRRGDPARRRDPDGAAMSLTTKFADASVAWWPRWRWASVGTAMGLINDIPTVGDLVSRIVEEAEELITGRLADMIEPEAEENVA